MRQIATYWAPGGNDGTGGVTFAAPVQIRCRWQDTTENFQDARGQLQTCQSIVYPESPCLEKGYLALGPHTDADPRTVPEACEIRATKDSPALAGARVLDKVWL